MSAFGRLGAAGAASPPPRAGAFDAGLAPRLLRGLPGILAPMTNPAPTPDDVRAALEAAAQRWSEERDALEDALSEGADLDGPREALFDAERALTGQAAGIAAGLARARDGWAAWSAVAAALVAALQEVSDQAALEAERSATHGEMAGAGHVEDERRAELDAAADALRDAVAGLDEALDALRPLGG